MENNWDIGMEARQLDDKHIMERMKIERNSFKKIFVAILLYVITMLIFSILL